MRSIEGGKEIVLGIELDYCCGECRILEHQKFIFTVIQYSFFFLLFWSIPIIGLNVLAIFCRPKVKSPPQEILLKLEKEPELKELSQESSKLVFKLGLSKIQCSLLMNGLVIDPNEVMSNDILNVFLYIILFPNI